MFQFPFWLRMISSSLGPDKEFQQSVLLSKRYTIAFLHGIQMLSEFYFWYWLKVISYFHVWERKGGEDWERERKLLFTFSFANHFLWIIDYPGDFFKKKNQDTEFQHSFPPFFTALNWGEDFSRRRNICAGKRGREKKIKCRHTPE